MIKNNAVIRVFLFFTFFFLITISSNLYSDTRSEPKDIIIALDKSKSMEGKIEGAEEYINQYIIDALIPGDYLALILFWGSTESAFSGQITDANQKASIKKIVSSVKPDGAFTDIGNAFDRLGDLLKARLKEQRKMIFLLFTDDINEPQKNSKYYSADRKLKHEYQQYRRDVLEQQGWKMQILMINPDSTIEELAKILDMKNLLAKDRLPKDSAEDINTEPLGSIVLVQGSVKPLVITSSKKGILEFTLLTSRFNNAPELAINSIELKTSLISIPNILEKTYIKTLPVNGETKILIPVKLSNTPVPGDYQAKLLFGFSSEQGFNESPDILLQIKSGFNFSGDWSWLGFVIIGIGILLIILLLIFFLRKIVTTIKTNAISFKAFLDTAPISKDIFKLTPKNEFFLNLSGEKFDLSPKKSSNSIGKLSFIKDGIKLIRMDESRFLNKKEIEGNILNVEIKIKTDHKTHFFTIK